MGNRLSKIYTRTGDGGETGLGDGSRVPKDSLRVEAYGCVDELSSVLGLLLTQTLPDADRERLVEVQHRLLDLGGELCIPGYEMITAGQVEALEQWLDALNAELPPLKEFILPGGAPASARVASPRLTALPKCAPRVASNASSSTPNRPISRTPVLLMRNLHDRAAARGMRRRRFKTDEVRL